MPTEGAHASDIDERVKELELRSAFTERTVEDLDAVVREFSLRVEKLEAELRRLRAQFEALGGITPDPRVGVPAPGSGLTVSTSDADGDD